jgi:hypothetical protein
MSVRNRNAALLALVCGLSAVAGCGQGLPPPADPNEARESLRVALDAWQQGAARETLLQRSPPIHLSDEDWKGGWTLRSYQIAPQDESHGHQRRCNAQLSLRSPKGKTAVKNVHYEIDTAPAIVIVRAFE